MDKKEKMIRALAAAKSIIDYSGGGDAWESECNAPEINVFYELYEEIFPEEKLAHNEGWCDACLRFVGVSNMQNHLAGKKHLKKLKQSEACRCCIDKNRHY